MSDEPTTTELSALLLLNADRDAGRKTGAPVAVSEQQLLALVAGELSEAERDTVLSAVAANDHLYHRWLQLLRGAAELAESPTPATAADAPHESLLTRIGDWLSPSRLAWIAAPALAASLVLMMMPVVETTMSTADLYGRWQTTTQPNISAPVTGFRGENSETISKDAMQQWFEWGVYNGLQKLGDGYAITGLPRYKLQGEQPAAAAFGDSLATMGEVTVLTYFVCQHKIGPAFIEDVTGIVRSLESVPDKWSLTVSRGENDAGIAANSGDAFCTRANALMSHLILLNS